LVHLEVFKKLLNLFLPRRRFQHSHAEIRKLKKALDPDCHIWGW
jgi:hypothetical protein